MAYSNYSPLILIAASVFILVGMIYLQVRMMSEPEKMFRSIEGGLTAEKQALILEYKQWLAGQQLKLLMTYQFGKIQVAVFQQENTSRFFSFYFYERMTFDIETFFNETTMLSTSTSNATGMFPRPPGSYKQGFPGMLPAAAWQEHLAAEKFLSQKLGITPKPLSQPYEQVLLQFVRRQMQHVRAIPFYPFLALYWFAVNRKRMANRSIEQQD